MVMKKIDKESLVSIVKSKKRFISILLIVLLGVGFFAGIKATSPDMEDTMNKYYQDTNFMDFDLKSTWGVSDNDISKLKDLGYNVEAAYELDSIVELDTEKAVKILSYNEEGLVSGITINYYRQDVSSNFEEAEIGDENAVNGLVCRPDIANIELKYDSDV